MEELTDDSPMPFGKKCKGMRLADVPGDYFLWLWEKEGGPQFHRKPHEPLHRYISKNWKRICNDDPDYDPANHPPRDTRTATMPLKNTADNPHLPQPGIDY